MWRSMRQPRAAHTSRNKELHRVSPACGPRATILYWAEITVTTSRRRSSTDANHTEPRPAQKGARRRHGAHHGRDIAIILRERLERCVSEPPRQGGRAAGPFEAA